MAAWCPSSKPRAFRQELVQVAAPPRWVVTAAQPLRAGRRSAKLRDKGHRHQRGARVWRSLLPPARLAG